MPYIILDLDNCISDDEWRTSKIKWDEPDLTLRYRDYHLLAGFDKLVAKKHKSFIWSPVEEPRFQSTLSLLIFSARPESYAAITTEWLRRHNVHYSFLGLRGETHHGPSPELKCNLLNDVINYRGIKKEDIYFAFDDRDDVVAMYKEQGLRADVLRIHETKTKED